MNLSDIRSEIRVELEESTAEFWTNAELDSYINDGVLLIQELTEWYEDTANILPVVGQQDYTLPTNCLVLKRVTWDEKFLPQTSEWELDRDNQTWRGAANDNPIRHFIRQWDTLSSYPKPKTAGTGYTFDAETGCVIRIEDGGVSDPDVTFDSELGIVIAIEDSEGGQVRFTADTVANPFTLTSAELGEMLSFSTDEENWALYFSAYPDTMTVDADVPQLHACLHPALVPYACFRALVREGPHQNIKLAKQYFDDFGDWMEAAMHVQRRQFPDKVFSWKAVERGSAFENRLSAIGGPSIADLLPSYP